MKLISLLILLLIIYSCNKKKNDIYCNYEYQDSVIYLCFDCNNGIWKFESDTNVVFNIIELTKNYSIVEFPITIPFSFNKDTVEYRTVTYPNHLETNPKNCDSIVLYNDYGYPRFVFSKNGNFVEDWRNVSDKGILKKLKR